MIDQIEQLVESDHVRLPAQRFYWGVLDASRIGGRATATQLGYLFESVLPVPIEDVHAIYRPMQVPMGEVRIIACGMTKASLADEINRAGAPIQSLGPETWPDFIRGQLGESNQAIESANLNLLVDQFEPVHVKVLRRRLLLIMAAILILTTAILSIGLERRVSHTKAEIARTEAAGGALLDQVLPNGRQSNLPAELQLVSELRTLRQTRTQPLSEIADFDSSSVLESLLRAWPSDLHIQTESLMVIASGITVRATAPNSADVQRLADALSRIGSDWQVQQPQVNAGRDSVQATIQLKPVRKEQR